MQARALTLAYCYRNRASVELFLNPKKWSATPRGSTRSRAMVVKAHVFFIVQDYEPNM